MGDEFDPCECIWNHEFFMRRLLSFIRNSQSHCTDSECYPDGPSNSNTFWDEGGLMLIMMLFAMVMYFIGPNFQRNSLFDSTKPRINNNGSNDNPPPRPPPASL